MARQYADRITAHCAQSVSGAAAAVEPRPERFLWRGRRYRVLAVVQHWVEVGLWWRGARATDEEYDLWRVEAAAGRQGQVGQFDLCRHRETGHWFLVRAFD